MSEYLDYLGLSRYHELINNKKADKTELKHTVTVKSGLKSDNSTEITATSSEVEDPVVTLGDSGVTAKSYGDSANQTPAYNETFKVPYFTVNAKGIITAASEHTVKIPASDNTNTATLKVGSTTDKKISTDETSDSYISFIAGTNKFTVSDGTNSFDVAVTPSISKNVTGSGLTANTIVLGNGNSAVKTSSKTIATTLGSDDTTIPTSKAVQTAITDAVSDATSDITNAMVFKGTIGKASGGSGTVSALPTSNVKIGHSYKIVDENKTIAAANSATDAAVTAKVGDTIIATDETPKWVVIPSGDEPSGTVTSVAATNGNNGITISGSPITSSGTLTISHGDTSSAASASNSGRTYIQSVTLDDFGHVTALTSATETVTNTDTKVTSAANHYSPTADSNSELTATISGTAGAYAKDTEYTVLTGVKAQRDAKGHITGLTYTAQKIKDTNNTYTVNNGQLSLNSKIGNTSTTISSFTANLSTAVGFTLIQGDGITFTNGTNAITISANSITYGAVGTAIDSTKLVDALFV